MSGLIQGGAQRQPSLPCWIGGRPVLASTSRSLPLYNPATLEREAWVPVATVAEVESAVQAAGRALPGWSTSTVAERIRVLEAMLAGCRARRGELAEAMRREMGAPVFMAESMQACVAERHLEVMLALLPDYPFESWLSHSLIMREAVGVCALITPWNWPLNQVLCKLVPALAAGCTVILKPSEQAPLSAALLAEILQQADLPPGVFNLLHGDGLGPAAALAAHPQVDMVSFTGSVGAGVAVAQAAAPTVKRVTQELGGKSASMVLPGAELERAVRATVAGCLLNSGQTCKAPTRLLVPRAQLAQVLEMARDEMLRWPVGDPQDPATGWGRWRTKRSGGGFGECCSRHCSKEPEPCAAGRNG